MYFLLTAGIIGFYFTLRSQVKSGLRHFLIVGNVVGPLLLFAVVLLVHIWFVDEGKRHLAESNVSQAPYQSVGEMHLPALPLRTVQGDEVQIESMIRSSKVAVLVFFACYDSPWSHNPGIVNSIYGTKKSAGLVAIGIDEQEPKDIVQKFIYREGISFPVLLDIDGQYRQSLHLFGSTECVLVVDANGRVLEKLLTTEEVQGRLADIVRLRLDGQNGGG